MAIINVTRKFALHDYTTGIRHEFVPGTHDVSDELIDADHPLSWWIRANTDQEAQVIDERTRHNAASRYNATQELLLQAKQRERLEAEANSIHSRRVEAPAEALAAAHAEVARLQAIIDAQAQPTSPTESLEPPPATFPTEDAPDTKKRK